jgi:hypothetical protein
MTIINGIEIDNIKYVNNPIKETILNNTPIENNLHVIMVISNPCQFAKRYILAKEFKYRMEKEPNVILYIVELAFKNQTYHITEQNNKRHLQLYTDTEPIWHKENMINIGVNRLLPLDWKAFAWIDADIEFDNANWAIDALKILNGSKDIIQLFGQCLDMDNDESIMSVWTSFGFQYSKGKKYSINNKGNNLWHPGYAWAITKSAYIRIGGLFEHSILGSGDHNMALSLLGHGIKSVNHNVTNTYKDIILEFQDRIKNLRLGYIPGVIRHYFHGSKINRKYSERWQILVKHQYDPLRHITKDSNGLLIPSKECPPELLIDIMNYFQERNEDE